MKKSDRLLKTYASIKLKNETNIYMPQNMSFEKMADKIAKAYAYLGFTGGENECRGFVKSYVNSPNFGKGRRTSRPTQARTILRKNHTVSPDKLEWYKSKEFLLSDEWFKFRYRIIELHGNKCQCCGATPATGAIIQVDHIKPRSIYPELALVESNAQILCRVCNLGKSNLYKTDWR